MSDLEKSSMQKKIEKLLEGSKKLLENAPQSTTAHKWSYTNEPV